MPGPTVLDSFVLEFGLDASKFSDEQKKLMEQMAALLANSKKSGDQIEAVQKKVMDLFSVMRREAVVALGGFFGGKEIIETLNHFTGMELSAARIGKQLGMNARETVAWGKAFQAEGMDPKAGISALATVNQQLMDFHGKMTVPPMWSFLGINPNGPNGIKGADELLLEMATNLQNRRGTNREKAWMLGQAGASADTTSLLLEGPDKIRKLLAEQRKLIPNIDGDIEKLKEYQQAATKLSTAWDNLGMAVTRLLAGPVAKFLDMITNALGEVGSAPPAYPSRNQKSLSGRAPSSAGEAKFNGWMNYLFPTAKYGPLGDNSMEQGGKRHLPISKKAMAEKLVDQHPDVAYWMLQNGGFGAHVAKTDFDSDGKYNFVSPFGGRFGGDTPKPFDYNFNAGGGFSGGGKAAGGTVINNNNVTVNDKSGNPGKQAGIALEHMRRVNLAYGAGNIAQG